MEKALFNVVDRYFVGDFDLLFEYLNDHGNKDWLFIDQLISDKFNTQQEAMDHYERFHSNK